MFAFTRTGLPVRLASVAKPVSAAALALMLSACASSKAPSGPQVLSWMFSEPRPAVRPVQQVPVEIEDDGLPAQAAPSYRIHQLPDNPNEPWSRNYGGPAAERVPLKPDPAKTAAHDDEDGRSYGGAEPEDAAAEGDEGLPVPKSPAEAGVRLPEPEAGVVRRASLSLPSARCQRSGSSWLCTR